MGDGWEIENSSSEKVQSVHSSRICHSVSQRRNSEGPTHEISKFDSDFKSTRRFSERADIAHLQSVFLSDSKTESSLQDVMQQRAQKPEDKTVIPSSAFVGDNSAKRKIYCSEFEQITTTFEGEDGLWKISSDMNMERDTKLENTSSALKYQCSSFKDNENTDDNNGAQQTFLNEKNANDFSDLSLERKANGHGAVMSSTVCTIASCREENASTETKSAEIMQNKPPRLQEKEISKKRISFRALVRMKGLGRRMRKKQQNTKKREKYSNHRNESGQIKEFRSDSSAKNLLESSTSTSEEQTFTQMKIAPRKEEPAKSLQRSQSLNPYCKDTIVPNSDEVSCSSSGEIFCSSGYLERRRGAVCEELEKTLVCGEQSLADLRAILVVQQKLTGFGLL